MENNIDKLFKYLPDKDINWDLINKDLLSPFLKKMQETMQEPSWHAEGDVYTHTKMVCENLIKLDEYNSLTKIEKLVIFLSALFHDVAKPICTKIENGKIVSPKHGPKGAQIVREYLWTNFSLSGKKEYQEFRESICLLIKFHSLPINSHKELLDLKILKIACSQNLAPYFSNKLLVTLSKADALGRIGNDDETHFNNIANYTKRAIQLDCYDKAFNFPSDYTKYQYLNKAKIWYNQELYNPCFGKVIIVCGLPGTGKDTYIKNNYPNLNMISLDNIRKELKIKDNDDQGRVSQEAKNKMKEYLRSKTPFIFNATNLSTLIRQKYINIIHDYKANVEIIFLETEYQENLKRNKERKAYVSEHVINELISKIDIPEVDEAETIKWLCI